MEERKAAALPPDPGLVSLDRAATSEGSAGPASRPRDALAPGSLLAGRYRIERFLARGGMGEVHEAHDQLLDVTLALKTLRLDLEGDLLLDSRTRGAAASKIRPPRQPLQVMSDIAGSSQTCPCARPARLRLMRHVGRFGRSSCWTIRAGS